MAVQTTHLFAVLWGTIHTATSENKEIKYLAEL